MSPSRPLVWIRLGCLGLAGLSACAESRDAPEDSLLMPDCAEVPTVLDNPVGEWVEAAPDPEVTDFSELVAAPGGDLIWLGGGPERMIRWTPEGEEVWAVEAEAGDWFSTLGIAATGELVVAGHHDPDPDQATLLLMRFDLDGDLEQRQVIDLPGSPSETIGTLAVAPAGELAVEIFLLGSDPAERRLAVFDADLRERWSVAIDEANFDLAIAGDGAVYFAQMELIEAEDLDYLWALRVGARDREGELAWTSEVIEVPSTTLPAPQLALGDRLYVLAAGIADARMFAFELDGELAWDHDFYAGDTHHHVGTLAASPCGGVVLGGRTSVPMLAGTRASLATMSAAGALGDIVALTAELPDDHRFATTRQLAISPVGDIVATGELQRFDEPPNRAWIKTY